MAVTAQMAVLASLAAPSVSLSRSRSVALPAGGFRTPLKQRRQRAGMVRASGMAEPESAGTGGSGMVDSNMMVLRKRIQNIRIQETCFESPADWAEWERTAYPSYRADVCFMLSTMQSQLLTLRPGTVISIVSVLMAVVPVMSILFLSAVGTQLWSLHCALLELGASLHQLS